MLLTEMQTNVCILISIRIYIYTYIYIYYHLLDMHCKYIHSLVILIYFDSVSPFCVTFLLALLHIECLKGTVSSGLMNSDTGGEDSNRDLQLPRCAKAAVREIRCSQQRTGILTSQTRASGARSAQSCAKTQSKQHGQQTVDPWTTRVLTWLKTRMDPPTK